MIKKIIVPVFLGVLVSFFFYPVGFTFLTGKFGSKNILAIMGLVFFAYDCVKTHGVRIPLDLARSAFIAVFFSLSSYLSITVNNTDDTTYSRYIMSFLVWTFSAYTICFLLRLRYDRVDLRIITRYLAAVAVVQCILSQMIDLILPFQILVDSVFSQDQGFLHQVDRLYGIGAALDSAGVKFSVTQLLLAYFIVEDSKSNEHLSSLKYAYMAFIIITVLGNMIARTTLVGSLLGICYVGVYFLQHISLTVRISQLRSIGFFIVMLAILIPVLSRLYAINPGVRENLRFGFEGFFNWKETGVWRTDSTDKLSTIMWVWPKDPKSWFIGTGLFEGWVYGTDIGYCRFILYCGLLGFSLFAFFFIHNSWAFYMKFPGTGILSFLMLAMTFIIWLKVSTDIYPIYALIFWADAPKILKT